MKKRIFNTAVAVVAAMSLSAGAFAEAAPGASNPGWSDIVGGSNYSLEAEVEAGQKVVLTSDEGISVEGNAKDFPAGTTSVRLEVASGELSPETAEVVETSVSANIKKNGYTSDATVNYALSFTLYNQNDEEIEPVNPLKVTVAKNDINKDSNIVAYVDGDLAAEVLKNTFISGKTTFTFYAPHFSNYVLATVNPEVAAELNGDDEDNDTTTSNNTPSTGGGNFQPGDNSGNNSGDSSDGTTGGDSNDNSGTGNNGSNGSGTTGGNTTNTPGGSTSGDGDTDSDGSSNAGSTNGTGSDKNQATGVVLAVIPAAIAAAAVVISKKRK